MSSAAASEPIVLRVDLGTDVAAFFTTRHGGASLAPYGEANLGLGVGDSPAAVTANRDAVARLLGAPITWARPVHGADVALVGPGGAAPGHPGVAGDPQVDGLVTTEAGRGLAALAADCVPVLLVGRRDGATLAVGAVHAGRRGVVAGVVGNAVERLLELGATAVEAVVGPAVCGACYEVPPALREEVAALVPAAFATTTWGTPSLDLPGAVAAQLAAAGASARRLDVCTRETPELYSHRRDGVTGRFAGVIATRRPSLPGLTPRDG